MPKTTTSSGVRPLRRLVLLLFIVIVLFGSIGIGTRFADASWSPNLALDLEGGTQIILQPRVDNEAEITDEDINQAIEVIRQRVDGSGVAEAEITSQGGSNIVVALPGNPDEATLDLVRQSAQMRFRAFLLEGLPTPVDPAALQAAQTAVDPESLVLDDSQITGDLATDDLSQDDTTGDPLPSQGSTDGLAGDQGAGGGAAAAMAASARVPAATSDEASTPASDSGESEPAVDPEPTETAVEGEVPDTPGQVEATPTYTQEELEAAAFLFADQDTDGVLSDTPATEPTSASDPAWLTEQIYYDFALLDCTDPANLSGGAAADPDVPLVTCARDGTVKYILGPAELEGSDLADANSGVRLNERGQALSDYAVYLEFTNDGGQTFAEVTTRLSALTDGTNRFAIVLDGLVISAPSVDEPIPSGEASITGGAGNGFDQQNAATLANQLSFGALPISFEVQSEDQISATLGTEQLQRGLLAGLIGLLLVVLYSLAQYRGLALVTVASLIVAGALTYGVIALLSWVQGYRLSLAGVAGLIVAIGITADSFVVYFERIRDEVREGRRLDMAVEQGWRRARRTILASDAVNLLAAVVLYFLAVGGVRGFAFTLGLTTIIDLIVVFTFTHPMLQLLIRTRFYGEGHRFSGLDATHLGASAPAYRGRGSFRSPAQRQTIAERRRAQEESEQDFSDPGDDEGTESEDLVGTTKEQS
ncbi:MAG: protein translocase subunit SecD [Beutenbergiaceae bacterium]